MEKPITTLFLLESVDGKINSGSSDVLDVDQDWCLIDGVKEGLKQYYEIEQTTDMVSLNTGRVFAKIGVNEQKGLSKTPCSFVVIDNKPHLKESGIQYVCDCGNMVYLVTTNQNHVAHQMKCSNLIVLDYETLDLKQLLHDLKTIYGIERLTIQSGGSLNELFVRENLLDYVHIVIAPLIVGGKDTPTLVDGTSITTVKELDKLHALTLVECSQLEHSYIELIYKVIKKDSF